MNRFDWYPGDYLKDTLGLSMTRDCIYRRLIDSYYSTEQPIPDEEKFDIVRAFSEEQQKETQWVLDRFFEKDGSVWKHAKIEQEIEKAMKRVTVARGNGRKGGRPKKQQVTDVREPSGFSLGSECETKEEPKHNPGTKLPSPSPPLITIDKGAQDVPCPADLALTLDQAVNLKMGIGITDEVIARWVPILRARFEGDDPRSVERWRKSLITALTSDWNTKRDQMLGRKPPPRTRGRGPIQPNHGKSTKDFLKQHGHGDG